MGLNSRVLANPIYTRINSELLNSRNDFELFQGTDTIRRDTSTRPLIRATTVASTQSVFTGEARKLVPQFSPLSPSAASLQKFGDYQVSLATGIPEISIPIHVIEEGGIKIPITLDYHASGFKLNEQASWVGLGWSLNYGPTLNRTVQGLPDDAQTGFFRTPYASSRDFCRNFNDFNFGVSATRGQIDTQPDIFSYKLFSGKSSRSGRFLLGGSNGGAIMRIPDYAIQIIPQGSASFSSFELVNDDGYSYVFGGLNAVESQSVNNGFSTQTYNSSWLITDIRSPNSDDRVQFAYQSGGSQFSQDRQWVATQILNAVPQSGGNYTNSQSISPTSITSESTLSQFNPRNITFTNGRIEFIQSNPGERLDLPNSRFLREIRIFSRENGQEVLRRVIRFSYAYFTHSPSGRNKRLRLTQISFQNANGSVSENYIPEYWSNTLSWDENFDQTKIDFFGYYNGQSNNHTLAFSQINGVSVVGGAANRSTVATFMREGVLRRLTYPSGGHTEFEFEPNQVNFGSGPQLVGGLRVTAIRSTTGNSTFLKRYQYGPSNNGVGFLTTNWTPNNASVPTNQQLIHVGIQQGSPVTSRATMATFTQNGGALDMNTQDAAPVYYTHVAEFQEDAQDPVKNGRTEYVFDFRVDLIRNTVQNPNRDVQPWKRGNLLSKLVYSSDNTLVQRVDYTYQELKNSSQMRGSVVTSPTLYEGSLPRSTTPCSTTFLSSPPGESSGMNPEMLFTPIAYQSGIMMLVQTTERLDNVETRKRMAYNSNLLLSESFTEGSILGESRGELYRYPNDPIFAGNTVASQLIARNQQTEVLEREIREIINGTPRTLYRERINYANYNGFNSIKYPASIQRNPTIMQIIMDLIAEDKVTLFYPKKFGLLLRGEP